MKKNLIFLFCLIPFALFSQTWNTVFVDPILQNLIQEGLQANSDIRTAELSVKQAETLLNSANLSYLPNFMIAPSATFSKVQGQKHSLSYELPLKMEWELSLGGKQRFRKQSAKMQVHQNQQLLKYMQIVLVADIANAYYTLITLEKQLEISQQALEIQKENVSVFRALKEVGKQNEIAVNQAQADCQGVEASLPSLELQIQQTKTALCMLLNRPSGDVEHSRWDNIQSVRLENIDTIPLEKLSERADVAAAQYGLQLALNAKKAAKSDFYPTLSISGSVGWTNNIGEIIDPAKILLNAIGSLTQPLFQQRRLKSNLQVAQYQYEQAQIAFEKTLLVAGGELQDALFARDACLRRETTRKQQVESYKKAYETSVEFMRYSNISYLEILTAQKALLESQLLQTAEELEKQQSMINIYKALGIF
ncbi:MAG: TolC family protein [Bacteroidales bacterium]|nr:TolC family protein [Bacteroidales bacterium]MBR7035994.1 TolC family protein [Bacteroidales bacterium]